MSLATTIQNKNRKIFEIQNIKVNQSRKFRLESLQSIFLEKNAAAGIRTRTTAFLCQKGVARRNTTIILQPHVKYYYCSTKIIFCFSSSMRLELFIEKINGPNRDRTGDLRLSEHSERKA